MMRLRTPSSVTLAAAGLLCLTGCVLFPDTTDIAFNEVDLKAHRAVTPEIQTAEWTKDWWMPRHESIKKGSLRVVLI